MGREARIKRDAPKGRPPAQHGGRVTFIDARKVDQNRRLGTASTPVRFSDRSYVLDNVTGVLRRKTM